ncbi:HalX domain-containing protein [Halosolutus gelatinilyticus]|uniref:HalX domain-containing protein n=1 Tax=Halosolutus gelatinilyticus TaxID=2931975 RepID=UPI001FF6E87B|nr:HalX domain-containing protein [Halosolutus gelatinilyticus]
MPDDTYTVLVVADEPGVVEQFEGWLSDRYRVTTVIDGDGTREDLDDVDVALLDRVFPAPSGDVLAREIDRRERDRTIALAGTVEPETDVLRVTCHESLDDPVERDELVEIVERLRSRARYDDRLAECANLAAERAALEAARSRSELERDEEYQELCRRIAVLLDDLNDATTEFDAEDFRAAFETPDFAGRPRVQRTTWLP